MKRELISSIKEKEYKLSQLKCHINKSEVCSDLYDKMLLEKAVLKKQLDDMSQNSILKRIKHLIPRKGERLICDYFHN